MPLRQLLGDPFSNVTSEFSVELDSWFHQQEQNNTLIMVLRSTLAYAETLCDLLCKASLKHRVDVRTSESNSTWVQNSI